MSAPPFDLPGIRKMHPAPFFAVTPGIRPAGGATHDQQRVTTVAEAVRMELVTPE